MKLKSKERNSRAFTLVETLLMLCALGAFTLTTLAVLKKDHFSLEAVLAKFHEDPMDTPINLPVSPSPGSPAQESERKRPVPQLDHPSTILTPDQAPRPAPSKSEPAAPTTESASAPVRESAKAGSPAPTVKP